MVNLASRPRLPARERRAYRLVNSQFPPISVFDDVAEPEAFEALYALQSLTNPRLQNEVGNLELIPMEEIPFGIAGCSYAVAPFTHVNPDGTRFSDGSFGALYLADSMDTALAEVLHHQEAYWRGVPDLCFDRFVFRGLACDFEEEGVVDGLVMPKDDPVYAPADYSASQGFGRMLKQSGAPGLRYPSVRAPGAVCWVLMTPRPVVSVVQAAHYEMVWNGAITSVSKLSQP